MIIFYAASHASQPGHITRLAVCGIVQSYPMHYKDRLKIHFFTLYYTQKKEEKMKTN